MKDKILLFVIGVLVGAVIATGAFFVYSKSSCNNNSGRDTQMRDGEPPEKPNGENGQPPELPGNDNQNRGNNNER